jgi:NADH-quinone oxidoreductase subunit G
MPTVYVNDKPVEIGDSRLNAIQAAELAGIFVPHYCWHPALSVVASCRMCLIEIGERKDDGTVTMQPRVVPGCQTPVKHGTVIVTGEYDKRDTSIPTLSYPTAYGLPGERSRRAQEDTLEGLLLNHPLDCPVCDKAGECKLQDFSYEFGRATSRLVDPKNTPPNKPGLSSKITLFTDRCIMCTRCVRFTREVSGQGELQVINRGNHSEIDIFPDMPLENKLSGNVVDLCPVGALGSKDFLYTQRVWYLKTDNSVCPGCSTGCSIHVDSNKSRVYRIRPRENSLAQGYFICDDGRFGYQYHNSNQRIRQPLTRRTDEAIGTTWDSLIPTLRREIADAVARNARGVIAVLSPYMTCEEAFLAAKYFKLLSSETRLAISRTPVIGHDDTYPKDRRGQATDTIRFTIRAEKTPNRRGVEAIIRHFEGSVPTFDDVIESVRRSEVDFLFISNCNVTPCETVSEQEIDTLKSVTTSVLHDLLLSRLMTISKYIIPATTFVEKDGTYVNHSDLAQLISRCTTPPIDVRPELQLFHELLGQAGLCRVVNIRRELAQTIPFFSALDSIVDSRGVRLQVNT